MIENDGVKFRNIQVGRLLVTGNTSKGKGQKYLALHQSGEDYLETILVLQKQKGMVCSVDVARHRNVSKPSVCHAYLHGQFTRASLLKGTALCGGLGRGVSAWDKLHGEYPRPEQAVQASNGLFQFRDFRIESVLLFGVLSPCNSSSWF